MISLSDAPVYDPNRVAAESFLEGSQCNVRVIRLGPRRVANAAGAGLTLLAFLAPPFPPRPET